MKNEMFDDQGKFVERDVHAQVFDHSQELPAVEVVTADHMAIFTGAACGIMVGKKTILDGL
ncbi:MAG: hypothetical protein V1857_00300 [archaeon]